MERIHHTPEIPLVEVIDSLPVCTHSFQSGRHCRQAVAKIGDLFCATHARRHALSAPFVDPFLNTVTNPLAELASELGADPGIPTVKRFLAKVLKLACQNRISVRRAAALTYIANSLLNGIRLDNLEQQQLATEEQENFKIDLTGFPRPERDLPRVASSNPPEYASP